MKKFEFDYKTRNWDRYREFHKQRGPFVEFEDGSLSVTYLPRPNERRYYGRYDVELVTTADHVCPTLYLDEGRTQAVPWAWLNQRGQQHLAIDHEQKVAVSLGHHTRGPGDHPSLRYLPENKRHGNAVWMGPERLPLPLGEVSISRPDNTLKPELKEKLADVRAACRAAVRIQGLDEPYGVDPCSVSRKWVDWSVEDIYAHLSTSAIKLRDAAYSGFAYPRAVSKHELLWVK